MKTAAASFFRNVEYLLLAVMSELSTVRCDRALGLWLQVHGRRVSVHKGQRRASKVGWIVYTWLKKNGLNVT